MLRPWSLAEPGGRAGLSRFSTGTGSLLRVSSCWALGFCLGAPAPEAAPVRQRQAPPSGGAGAWLGWRSSGGAGSEGFCLEVLSRSCPGCCPSCRVTSVLPCPLTATPLPGLAPRGCSVPSSPCTASLGHLCPQPGACSRAQPQLPRAFCVPRRNISLVPDPSPGRLWRLRSVPVGLSWQLPSWNVTCGACRAQVTVVLVMKENLLFQLDATEFTWNHDVSFCLDSLGLG